MLYQDTAEEVPSLNQTHDLSPPSKTNLWRHEWGQMQTLRATRDYFTHCCIFGVCYLKIVSQRKRVSECRSLRVLQHETTRESRPLLLGLTSTIYNHWFSVCWSSGWTCPCAYLWQFITSFLRLFLFLLLLYTGSAGRARVVMETLR